MTQNKARRTNKIDFLQLPWSKENFAQIWAWLDERGLPVTHRTMEAAYDWLDRHGRCIRGFQTNEGESK